MFPVTCPLLTGPLDACGAWRARAGDSAVLEDCGAFKRRWHSGRYGSLGASCEVSCMYFLNDLFCNFMCVEGDVHVSLGAL